jgi:hypothetical protein
MSGLDDHANQHLITCVYPGKCVCHQAEAAEELCKLKMDLDAAGVIVLDFKKQRDQALACNDDLAKMNAQLSKNLKASLGETINAVGVITKLRTEIDLAAKVIVELRDKPFTAAYTHNADKWLEVYSGKPPEGMGSFDAVYPPSLLPDEGAK